MTRSILVVALLAISSPGCDSAQKKTDDKPTAAPVGPGAATVPATPTAGPSVPPADKTAPTTPPAAPISKPDSSPADDRSTKPHGATPSAVAKPEGTIKAADPATPTPDKPAEPAADAGGSLAQKEGWANYTKELNRKVDQVNTACGTKLTASYDKSTYTDFDPMKDRTQSACQAAVGTLSAICASDPGKQSVAKLTKATCKFSTSGTGASVSGSTLVIKIDPEKSSITGKAAGSYSWSSAIKEHL